jgi:hypothetical protein
MVTGGHLTQENEKLVCELIFKLKLLLTGLKSTQLYFY